MSTTDAQRIALKILSDGEPHDTSRHTRCGSIHGGVAKALLKHGLVRTAAILDGREIWGIDLITHMHQWRIEYLITEKGRRALAESKKRGAR